MKEVKEFTTLENDLIIKYYKLNPIKKNIVCSTKEEGNVALLVRVDCNLFTLSEEIEYKNQFFTFENGVTGKRVSEEITGLSVKMLNELSTNSSIKTLKKDTGYKWQVYIKFGKLSGTYPDTDYITTEKLYNFVNFYHENVEVELKSL